MRMELLHELYASLRRFFTFSFFTNQHPHNAHIRSYPREATKFKTRDQFIFLHRHAVIHRTFQLNFYVSINLFL